ncbi:MAG: DNA polymerase, partial [Nitrosopumilus sp.]
LCKEEADEIEAELNTIFKPRATPDREFTPKATKAGGIARSSTGGEPRDVCNVGGSFTRIKWKDFSITSTVEKVARLKRWWKPIVRTKTGKSWQLCEENLATLPDNAPEGLSKLARWSILNSRHKTIHTEGKQGGWFANTGWDSRVHGYVDGLGAYTGRCAHQKPNLANVPAIYDRQGKVAIYGKEMRECFTVENTDTHCIVGTDASGIQLRVLAHYINNPEYTKTIVEGRKEDKTDIHNVNMRSLGKVCANRGIAKTFIYAWLLGGKVGRMMSILSCTKLAAGWAMHAFVKKTPGLDGLLYRKTAAAKRGYLVGLDGRRVSIPSDHHSLAVYLQNGEAVIMKLAMVLWNRWATNRSIDYKQCAFVHHEWQSEVEIQRADELGELQVKSIVRAGELLNLNIPLDGEYMIAKDWSGAH